MDRLLVIMSNFEDSLCEITGLTNYILISINNSFFQLHLVNISSPTHQVCLGVKSHT